ncbi:MAG: 2-keto-4-pentenoate hydratase [Rhodospirillales bacterium]|nr:2-keto-4-pentenoate hydratase [Rhodospirillales bacterium]MSP80092.1 2-keto-4-pentenoate hydratase [Rhodospirillales bacterium]
MIDDADARAFAQAYFEAERTRVPIGPLTEAFPDLTLDDAYRIQDALVARLTADGQHPFGIKVGSTSAAAQRRFKTAEPVIGTLFLQRQVANGGAVATERLIAPRIECEIAVRMGADLKGPGVTPDAAEAAFGSLMGAFEIVDARTRDWRIAGIELVADNAINAGFVLGPERPAHGLDAAGVSVMFGREGDRTTYGSGANVMGGPKFVIAWLANWMGARGKTLARGTVVLTGSLSEILPANKGDRFKAEFTPLGEVEVRFD